MSMFEPSISRGHKANLRYRSRQIAMVNAKFTGNTTDQVGNPAILILVQQAEPPAATEYQAWLDGERSSDPRATKPKATGEKLRRAVRMIRNGYSVSACERTLGSGLRQWIKRLPPELSA